MDGCPLGLGLVVEDKPTEFSCMYVASLVFWPGYKASHIASGRALASLVT